MLKPFSFDDLRSAIRSGNPSGHRAQPARLPLTTHASQKQFPLRTIVLATGNLTFFMLRPDFPPPQLLRSSKLFFKAASHSHCQSQYPELLSNKTPENAVKPQIMIAISVYVLVAIVKKKWKLESLQQSPNHCQSRWLVFVNRSKRYLETIL
jgi:hypothetical protein